jgi:OOP family OmpA-OmpF porin
MTPPRGLSLIRFGCLAVMLATGLSALHAQDPDAWDFVPGEKILLYDDYTDMPRGGAPPHWKVRGAAVRLVDGRLAIKDGEETTMWPNVARWPANFTIESEVSLKPLDNDGLPTRGVEWVLMEGADAWKLRVYFDLGIGTSCSLLLEDAEAGENQRGTCKLEVDKPNKFAIWMQDGRLRIYVNGERIVDMNQVNIKFDRAMFRISAGPLPIALGPARIAESAPDFSQTIFASGRYVSHGILFDVNSDQIKPESKPVLQQIADALAAKPELKLRIEGHTDSTGDAAMNLDLSKRRAASVKAALVGMGVAAERLTTEGLGDTKPVAGNDTPRGRAENRRVEFVKM